MVTDLPRDTRPSRGMTRARTGRKPTRDRILDAAERLFAQHGFDGVTMRQIMRAAGADVALAYYHFKSKRDLFDAVMLRRVETLNEIRLAALEEVERGHPNDPPSVEEIITAFVHPLLDLLAREPAKWRHYYALIAQINNSPEFGGALMTRYFDPLVKRFIAALRRALPGCDDADLYWSYHFLSGALTLTFAETGRLDNLSEGLCRSDDMAAANARMPAFIAAGFRALCKPRTAVAAPRAKRNAVPPRRARR
jgi:AcrR family transcriptional regulator